VGDGENPVPRRMAGRGHAGAPCTATGRRDHTRPGSETGTGPGEQSSLLPSQYDPRRSIFIKAVQSWNVTGVLSTRTRAAGPITTRVKLTRRRLVVHRNVYPTARLFVGPAVTGIGSHRRHPPVGHLRIGDPNGRQDLAVVTLSREPTLEQDQHTISTPGSEPVKFSPDTNTHINSFSCHPNKMRGVDS